MHPLYGLNDVERSHFVSRWLDTGERRQLEQALRYYRDVATGKMLPEPEPEEQEEGGKLQGPKEEPERRLQGAGAFR